MLRGAPYCDNHPPRNKIEHHAARVQLQKQTTSTSFRENIRAAGAMKGPKQLAEKKCNQNFLFQENM